jgi:prophage maintenance system killer protein
VIELITLFAGKDLYPSVEEKAAHLLYFIVKNHPFVDGNKRNGAYAFIWFLSQAKALDVSRITPSALTALTLLIAESAPKDKEKMIGLVCTVLAKKQKSKVR